MKKTKFFYGYWIVAACCLFCIVSSGCGLAVFGFFVKPLEVDTGWNRAQIMAAFTTILISMAITAPLVGWLVQRYSARIIISLGAFVEGAGFVLLSQMNSLGHYYTGYVLVGIGLAAASHVTTSFVVSQWFNHRRGTAIGIMASGIGLAGVAYSFLVGVYLIPTFGWSNTYLFLAANVVVLIIPLALLVIRNSPADMGLFPDGAQALPLTNTYRISTWASEGLSLKMALKTPAFWLIAIVFYLFGNHVAVGQGQTPYLNDIGFSVEIAASSFSILSTTSTIGLFFYGWLCDRIQARFATAIGLGITALGILVLINVGAESPTWMIWLFAAIFGLGGSSWLPTMSMLTSTTFGIASYGTIFGMLSFFQSLGSGAGPLIAGAFYDALGTFFWAFIFTLVLVILAIPVVLVVRRPVHLNSSSTFKSNNPL